MEVLKLRRCPLSLRRQCELLCIPRSALYYAPIFEKPENLKMMSLIDKHLTRYQTEGVLSMVDWQQERDYPVGPKRVRRMFKLMSHETIYGRKNLTKGALRVYIKPYLLSGLKIEHANQAWYTDIAYLLMARGFICMTAYIDVYSIKIMSWGISNSMSKQWCIDVLEAAIAECPRSSTLTKDRSIQVQVGRTIRREKESKYRWEE